MTTSLSFLGATDTVTGSQYLLRHGDRHVLVDCGLFQGVKKLRQRNWRPPAFNVAGLRDIVLSHAHLDHSGLLPRLYRLGFRGRVHCSLGTRDLLKILLPDAGYLQEEEARHANRTGYSRHTPALPLFTQEDAQGCLQLVKAYPFGVWSTIAKDIRVQFHRAGHIIGASSLALELGGRRVTFTGDVGRSNDPVMRAPPSLPETDYLICESTYGDRTHPQEHPEARLQEIVAQVCKRQGALLIPAFAVGRAQHILHLLARLRQQQRIAEIPIFLDSPMAIRATDLLERHLDELRLDRQDCRALYATSTFTGNVEDSKAIARRQGPMIVISASGMATGAAFFTI